MKITKFMLLTFVLALVVFAFAACGGETPAETEGGDVSPVTDGTTETDIIPETDENGEHVHTIVERIEEPTCEQRGYKREVCAVCEEQFSVKPIDMVDHTAAEPATCTKGSLCKFCGTVMASATGHKVDAYTDTKAATKTEVGYNKGKCSLCGEEVTEVIPAGITDNFNNFPAGALTVDVMKANSAFEGFDFKIAGAADGFEMATEGNNTYLKKLGVNSSLYYVSTDLDSDTLEITFDFRLDQDCKNLKGLLSLVSGGKEMRILNVKANGVYFGINESGIIRINALEVGQWIKYRVVFHTATLDYEVYANGELVLATASDPDNAGMHLVFVREEGEMVEKAPTNNDTLHNGADRSPFVPQGEAIEQFYFCHYSADLFCSFDNLTIGLIDAQ